MSLQWLGGPQLAPKIGNGCSHDIQKCWTQACFKGGEQAHMSTSCIQHPLPWPLMTKPGVSTGGLQPPRKHHCPAFPQPLPAGWKTPALVPLASELPLASLSNYLLGQASISFQVATLSWDTQSFRRCWVMAAAPSCCQWLSCAGITQVPAGLPQVQPGGGLAAGRAHLPCEVRGRQVLLPQHTQALEGAGASGPHPAARSR